MDAKETCTQRPRPEPGSKPSLIARAQQGEEAAFFALYGLHKARVYSICLRIAGTEQAAEKLTQNVFLGVFGQYQLSGTNVNCRPCWERLQFARP